MTDRDAIVEVLSAKTTTRRGKTIVSRDRLANLHKIGRFALKPKLTWVKVNRISFNRGVDHITIHRL